MRSDLEKKIDRQNLRRHAGFFRYRAPRQPKPLNAEVAIVRNKGFRYGQQVALEEDRTRPIGKVILVLKNGGTARVKVELLDGKEKFYLPSELEIV